MSSKNFDDEFDKELEGIKFFLPIPQTEKTKNSELYQILPGAPWTFCKNSPCKFRNTEELYEWALKEGDFNDSIINELQDYFSNGKGKEIRSFVCLPIMNPEEKPIAVLNIHSNEAGLLTDDRKFELFYDTMKPFLIFLEEMMRSKK
jgi:hypothetical protein